MARRLDFTDPATIKKAAGFPFYGQAQALIRTIDPLWKVDAEVDHQWKVFLERETHNCDCDRCHYSGLERKTETVWATDPEAAEAAALESAGPWGWDVVGVTLVDSSGIDVPDWIYETEGEA